MLLLSRKRYCPECHSRDIRRSTRRGLYESIVLPVVLLRPYRCERCDARVYGFVFAARVVKDKPDASAAPTPSVQDKLLKV